MIGQLNRCLLLLAFLSLLSATLTLMSIGNVRAENLSSTLDRAGSEEIRLWVREDVLALNHDDYAVRIAAETRLKEAQDPQVRDELRYINRNRQDNDKELNAALATAQVQNRLVDILDAHHGPLRFSADGFRELVQRQIYNQVQLADPSSFPGSWTREVLESKAIYPGLFDKRFQISGTTFEYGDGMTVIGITVEFADPPIKSYRVSFEMAPVQGGGVQFKRFNGLHTRDLLNDTPELPPPVIAMLSLISLLLLSTTMRSNILLVILSPLQGITATGRTS